jgi:C1A family cysteine protease
VTFEEFSNMQLDGALNEEIDENSALNFRTYDKTPLNLPNSIDWRAKNAVTPVKNQQSCGCGWAFATTASIEAAWEINSHPLISLSEQQLVDCSSTYGNKGCSGGTIVNALKYVQASGLANETAYPYVASTNKCSKAKAALIVAKISSYINVQSSSSNALMTAVVGQPVAVAVDANPSFWQFYSSGVIDGNCGSTVNHNVLVVWYFTIAGQTPYYICKNSWGPNWGLSGYVQVSIVDGLGTCGIQTSPAYPVV